MAKQFYTEKDIEDLHKRGVMYLRVTDDVVLTEMAYEKARRLGISLQRNAPDNPPDAPVRPYLSQPTGTGGAGTAPSAKPASSEISDLHLRIRTAVLARLGGQVDPQLVDTIISRVLKGTGLK